MKSLSKAIAVASLLSAGIMSAQFANAEVSFNAALASDYVWRGASQTDNGFAVSGGADYSHESGAYAGVWASNVDFGGDDSVEYDLYAGYALEVNDLEIDLGYISYNYDDAGNCCAELYVSVAKGDASVMLSTDAEFDAGSYLEGGYSIALPQDLGLDLHAGYTLPDVGDSVIDLAGTVGKSLEMADVALTVSFIDEDGSGDSEILAFVSVSKEF